jgi:hypothetical protein
VSGACLDRLLDAAKTVFLFFFSKNAGELRLILLSKKKIGSEKDPNTGPPYGGQKQA